MKEAKVADWKGDIRTIYKLLRAVGIRSLQTIQEEKFSPEEFKEHFMKVSLERYERDASNIIRTAEKNNEKK